MKFKALIFTLFIVFTAGLMIGSYIFPHNNEKPAQADNQDISGDIDEKDNVDNDKEKAPVNNGDQEGQPEDPIQNGAETKVKVAYVKQNNNIINVRTGPGTTHDIVTKVHKNIPMIIIGQEDDWYQVELPTGELAWVANWIVDVREE